MSEKFIPGIYNYCDRWCERCAFTDRCRNYSPTDNQEVDPSNENFWQNIHSGINGAIDLLKQTAKEYGLDLENIAVSAEVNQQEHISISIDDLRKHPLLKHYNAYVKIAMPFF